MTESRGNLSQITGKGSQLFPITLVTTINTEKPKQKPKTKSKKKNKEKLLEKIQKKKSTKKKPKNPSKEILNQCLNAYKNPNSNSKTNVKPIKSRENRKRKLEIYLMEPEIDVENTLKKKEEAELTKIKSYILLKTKQKNIDTLNSRQSKDNKKN